MINAPITLRPDLQVIADLVPEGAKLLDVGCGDGTLLAWLGLNKGVDGRGIELDAAQVYKAVACGLSVIQGDSNSDLADYPAQGYDYVILSQALQAMREPKAVLGQLLRIGRHAIVSVPNFAHWRNRLHLGVKGRMPVTKALAYQWYDTPNIHFCTLSDFVELCEQSAIIIERRIMVGDSGVPVGFYGKGLLANLLGQQGVFLLRKGS